MMEPFTYTLESLKNENSEFIYVGNHEMLESDVELVNACVAKSCKDLEEKSPKVGDSVNYTSQDGTFYKAAHIDGIENDIAVICLEPFIPFVFYNDGKLEFYRCSGGPFVQVPLKDLNRKGTTLKKFRVFSEHTFTKAHSAIEFNGYATEWVYREPNPFFGDFSTELYDRITFMRVGKNEWNIRMSRPIDMPADNIPIMKWLEELHGTIFGNFQTDSFVTAFVYKVHDSLIPLKMWNQLDLPVTYRKVNGSTPVPVMLEANDNTKTIMVYRYKNC